MKLGAFVMTYRRPESLRDTLRRLLAQSRPPDVIRVLDNGSSQEALRMVRELEDPRLRYVDLGDYLGPAGAAAGALLGPGRDRVLSAAAPGRAGAEDGRLSRPIGTHRLPAGILNVDVSLASPIFGP